MLNVNAIRNSIRLDVINGLFLCDTCHSHMAINRHLSSGYGVELYCKRCDSIKRLHFLDVLDAPADNRLRIKSEFLPG